MSQPELYYIERTPYVPGSKLPVIVYRGAVAQCANDDEIKEVLEANGGWEKGGVWNSFFRAHYHPNVPECYGIVAGSSELSIGRGPLDDASKGQLITVNKGDVMVLAAGISHCSSTATPDYKYLVLFPKGAPKWISLWCDDEEKTAEYEKECLNVPIPTHDPLEGEGGFLVKTWEKAAQA